MTATQKPRIAILGMSIESSQYAQHRADYRDFVVREGAQAVGWYPFLAPGTELGGAAQWLGVFCARSIPGGPVRREVYDDFKQRMLHGLTALGELDGIYLEIHGAMSVDGMDDAEGDLVASIRTLVGPEPLIAAPMDLHGNVSERFALTVDLPTCFRTAPHEDVWATRERSARTLLDWLARGDRPQRAWIRVPILLR